MQAVAFDSADASGGTPRHREAMHHAVRLIAPAGSGVSSPEPLLATTASWATHHHVLDETSVPIARLQSPRRKGAVPSYPRPGQLEGLREGKLILFRNGFVLEPQDHRHPCIHVASSTVRAATFYRDAFDVVVASRERIVIRAPVIDRIDSIFQAYYWNAMP